MDPKDNTQPSFMYANGTNELDVHPISHLAESPSGLSHCAANHCLPNKL